MSKNKGAKQTEIADADRNKRGIIASAVGLFCNIFLSALKITVGLIFASVAVLADGINNLTDAGSGVVNILGFKWASKPADKEHPFGHARYEYISGFIIAFIVIFFGVETLISSVEKIIGGGTSDTGTLVFVTLGISIAVKLGMNFYYRAEAKKISSQSLRAAATDSLNDCVATLAVLICAIIAHFTEVETDGYAGIAVAAFILFNGIKLVKETMGPLLGEKPSKELVDAIAKKVTSYEGVLGLHDLVVHNYGPNRYFASVHVEVDGKGDFVSLHEIMDEIERDFLADGIRLVAHMDPVFSDETTDYLKKMVAEEVNAIDNELKFHDFRVVTGKNDIKLLFDVVTPFDFRLSDEEITDRLQKKMALRVENCILIVTVEREMSY